MTFTTESGRSYDEWNEEKTRRMNRWDMKRYPMNNCPNCNGSGWIWKDWDRKLWEPCSCQSGIRVRNLTANAGLSKSIAGFRLNDFKQEEEWQTILLRSACEYAKNPAGFLFICGQPGAGKTHLAAGAFNYILRGGAQGKYWNWTALMAELKAAQNSPDYVRLMDELKECRVLFLDDFLHAVKNQPTAGDLKIAVEIIGARYERDRSPTIITSNLTTKDISRFDSSLSGRIIEAAGSHLLVISPAAGRDYRSRGAIEV